MMDKWLYNSLLKFAVISLACKFIFVRVRLLDSCPTHISSVLNGVLDRGSSFWQSADFSDMVYGGSWSWMTWNILTTWFCYYTGIKKTKANLMRITIALKGAIRDFLQSPHCSTNRLQHVLKWPGRNRVQITCSTSSAYHMQQVMLRATWYEGTGHLLSLTEFKSHLFEHYFIGWSINRWRRGGNRSTRRKPLATSFRKCHILKPEDSSPKRDSNPHWWQAEKADVLTVTPRVGLAKQPELKDSRSTTGRQRVLVKKSAILSQSMGGPWKIQENFSSLAANW